MWIGSRIDPAHYEPAIYLSNREPFYLRTTVFYYWIGVSPLLRWTLTNPDFAETPRKSYSGFINVR